MAERALRDRFIDVNQGTVTFVGVEHPVTADRYKGYTGVLLAAWAGHGRGIQVRVEDPVAALTVQAR